MSGFLRNGFVGIAVRLTFRERKARRIGRCNVTAFGLRNRGRLLRRCEQFDGEACDLDESFESIEIYIDAFDAVIGIENGDAAAACDKRNGVHSVRTAEIKSFEVMSIVVERAVIAFSGRERGDGLTEDGIIGGREDDVADGRILLISLFTKDLPAREIVALDDKEGSTRRVLRGVFDQGFEDGRLAVL